MDESALSGESMPVDHVVGDRLSAACTVVDGAAVFVADRVGSDTALARILRLLEDAAASKAPWRVWPTESAGYLSRRLSVFRF